MAKDFGFVGPPVTLMDDLAMNEVSGVVASADGELFTRPINKHSAECILHLLESRKAHVQWRFYFWPALCLLLMVALRWLLMFDLQVQA